MLPSQVAGVNYPVTCRSISTATPPAPRSRHGPPRYADPVQVETIAEQLFFTTVFLTGKTSHGTIQGTGFLYRIDLANGKVAPFLITNKHVLRDVTDLKIRFIAAADGAPRLGHATEITATEFHDKAWRGHPDPAVDLAAYPLAEAIDNLNATGAPPFYKSLGPAMRPTAGDISNLDAMEEVIFLGYPNGLYDTKNFLPVARRGVTASPIALDYRGEPAFLIDASVFPGSSGSPVFILNEGTYSPRGIAGLAFGTRFLFLGVLAAVHTRQVQGTVSELPARLAVTTPDVLDLGIVYKSDAIDDCVNPILGEAGAMPKTT